MGGEKKQEMCDMILISDWMGKCEVQGLDIRNGHKQRCHLLGQQEETHVVAGMCIFQCVDRKLRQFTPDSHNLLNEVGVR